MPEPIVYVDKSVIRHGKRDEVTRAIAGLVAFVEAHVPRALTYRIYLDESGREMTVVQIHPDSDSLELHLRVGAPAFARFKDLVQLTSIEVYGAPSPTLHERLLEKARALGGGTVCVHKLQAGFARFGR